MERRRRAREALQATVVTLLFIVLAGALALAADHYRLRRDVTQNNRNTLSDATRAVLQQLPGRIAITAYATGQDARLGDLRKLIRDFIAPYQVEKPDIALDFVDPKQSPQQAAAAGIKANGELVVEYGQKSEHLTTLTEPALANLLMRLARSSERLIAYLDGHGERKLNGIANHDLGEFGRQLQNRGFRITPMNLSLAQEVPDNVAVLIVAAPRVNLLVQEVKKLGNYVERGGQLLWLIDQEPLHGLEPLAEQLQLKLSAGTVVDPAAAEVNASPTVAVGAGYGKHAVTHNFTLNTLFPFARAIGVEAAEPWKATTLVQVAARGWIETGELDSDIRFDSATDTRGPIKIAAALTRDIGQREQRIAVIGNGHFLSNAYIGLGGNLDLGLNLINWLARDDNLIVIQPRERIDSSLELGRIAQTAMVVGFLIVMPLAFLFAGGAIWYRRRNR